MPLDRYAANGVVGTAGKKTRIMSAVLKGGSDAATADIANQETAGGDSVIPLNTSAANAVDRAIYGSDGPVLDNAGYITLTGTGRVAMVHWETVPD